MERFFLKSDRLHLRPLNYDDINNGYLSWFDDDVICEYNVHHRFPYSYEGMKSYIDNAENNKSMLLFAIVLNETNKHIGNIGISAIDFVDSIGEYGIVIGNKESWGKGYSFEASQLILDHLFNQLNINRVHCGTSIYNIGMQKLAEKLGFKYEGCMREHYYKNNEHIDIWYYGVLKREWNEKWK